MLSTIGLVLDIVGATTLALGLFRPASRLYPGLGGRTAQEAADDFAYGVVGLVFLSAGFLLQALPHLGVHECHKPATARLAGAIALPSALLIGFSAWKVISRLRVGPEQRRMR